jgi:hypothetical protein
VFAESCRWQASAKERREVLCTPDGGIRPGLEARRAPGAAGCHREPGRGPGVEAAVEIGAMG